ncbi:MAG: hypothetical protein IT422_28565 [Pirellulaceae bacterium]|jgi:hypothetical protein|nr:hypothetical protein [Pirellulaceae bacterium]
MTTVTKVLVLQPYSILGLVVVDEVTSPKWLTIQSDRRLRPLPSIEMWVEHQSDAQP